MDHRLSFVSLFFFFSSAILIYQCSSPEDRISYNEHIRPIFNNKCLTCHGGIKKMGGFSLLFEEEAFSRTKSGKRAIVPGNHRKSELYKRISHSDPEIRMPQDSRPLTTIEIQLISKWIDQGANWEQHWAYSPPVRKEEPKISSSWIINDIDRFVLQKLQQNGLEPENEANRYNLARRLSLDLTGLPPSPEMVNAYLNNPSPDAYEKLTDQLLDSPHFGERWTAFWLDLARYADSKGYEKDSHRDIWRYRDWLIQAFNNDMPFDQFTVEQLAGDLLPQANQDQLIATAFHRNTMTNTEGGTEDEEFRMAAVIDRVNTTFEVWQSSTIACVQCHSHPYDPIRHEEFYQLVDVFNHTLDQDLDTDMPNLELYDGETSKEIDEIIDFIQQVEPQKKINKHDLQSEQIKQAVFPVLYPHHCNDFENVTFQNNGSVSNWVYNLQAIGNKRFRFKFSQIDLNDLTHISYSYSTPGDDARLDIRIDSVNGKLLDTVHFKKTEVNRWGSNLPVVKNEITKSDGIHDLIFEIVNTSGKIPDGMLTLGKIELHYKDKFLPEPTLKTSKDKLIALRSEASLTPVMKAKSATFKRKTKVFERGNRLTPGKEVSGKVPEAFLPNGPPQDRLNFARWLVSEENPLTARVMVNRFWEQFFGVGIIASLEDLGTQGLQASHPGLLDYLALEFQNTHQWSIKKLIKQIVLSATYRQSSKSSPDKLEKDPFNRLFSRGARFRLSAEQIRDQALMVSGLLNDSIGGPSVMPLQPDGVWQIVYSGEKWRNPDDDSRFRRGLYTYWKRTAPYPSMVAFDSPSREFCMSRRIRTNTPLQALVTLNDPVYLEAARALGRKMEKAGKGNLEKAITEGFQLALVEEASEATIAVLSKLYNQAKEELEAGTTKAMTVAETNTEFTIYEPMTVVANAIMNLDGFLMKQ